MTQNTTITLYYKSLLDNDKNFILDNPSNGKSSIETYLNTLEKQTINNFQYVKQALNISIKIDKNQDALNMGLDSADLNYIKIQNDGANPCYYFIVNKIWKSENTIELILQMDSLNTYLFNDDYVINEKTLVKREHKDRFDRYQTLYFDWSFHVSIGNPQPEYFFYTNFMLSQANGVDFVGFVITHETNAKQTFIELEFTEVNGVKGIRATTSTISYNDITIRVRYRIHAYYRLIDMKSEEISAPVYKHTEEQLLEYEGREQISWSLYYKNASDQENAPVECYLVPDAVITSDYLLTAGEIDASNSITDYMIIGSEYNGELTFTIDGQEYTIDEQFSTALGFGDELRWCKLIAIKRIDASHIAVYTANFGWDYRGFGRTYFGEWQEVFTGAKISVNTSLSQLKYKKYEGGLPSSETWFTAELYRPSEATETINFGSTGIGQVNATYNIDRTNPQNIKIIDLPYSPSNYEVIGGNYRFSSIWKYNFNEKNVVLYDLNTSFKNKITTNVNSIYTNFVQNIPFGNIYDMKRFLKDSKLYHSDFFRIKFVYDSFSKIFPLEKIDYTPKADEDQFFKFTFVMSRNIISKFLFMFDFKYKCTTEDYDNVVAVSRNNEEVLYNSAYINYIRTGFNYDVKAKNRQEELGGLGIGLNALTFLGSAGIGALTGNPIALGSAFVTGVGLVSQLINYSKNVAQSEENIERKLQETKNQAVSVLNADDVDLLKAYSNNKAKLCYYRLSDQMQRILDDVFYYGGYVCNEQKIPDVRSRYWFNYLQASLIIEETNNLTEEIEQDIKQKFENGVTFLHYRNRYDFKQEMENIETKLV